MEERKLFPGVELVEEERRDALLRFIADGEASLVLNTAYNTAISLRLGNGSSSDSKEVKGNILAHNVNMRHGVEHLRRGPQQERHLLIGARIRIPLPSKRISRRAEDFQILPGVQERS